MAFTAHNIVLNDGTRTMPESSGLLEDSPTFQGAVRTMKNTFGSNLSDVSVIDLGCLEGGYTAGFARLGMNAKGIEVRQSNFDNCEIVRQGINLPNLSFVKDDVQNLDRYSTFDVTFCSGILYHLDKPRAFLEAMTRCTNKMIIIHTHYATYEPSKFPGLSEIGSNEGMDGRWAGEHTETDNAGREQHKWSSWENHRSFWLMKGGIFDLLQNNGFRLVYEQMDWLGRDIGGATVEDGPYAKLQRTMIVGVRV